MKNLWTNFFLLSNHLDFFKQQCYLTKKTTFSLDSYYSKCQASLQQNVEILIFKDSFILQ